MNIIGISGLARCGKDTFYSIARNILKYNGYDCMGTAFAALLKEEIQHMLFSNNFTYDINTNDTVIKNMLRPLMVWWGMSRRRDSNGTYWIDVVDKILKEIKDRAIYNGDSVDNIFVFIPDVRFKNEVEWIKSKESGYVIHLKKYSISQKLDQYREGHDIKEYDLPPNDEEKQNDPIVQNLADVKIEWENKNNIDLLNDESLRKIVLDALNSLRVFNGKLK